MLSNIGLYNNLINNTSENSMSKHIQRQLSLEPKGDNMNKMTFKQAVASLVSINDFVELGYDSGDTLYTIYMEEYGDFSGLSQMAVTEWVKGLPSVLDFPFNNFDILQELSKLGHKSVYNKKDREDKIINDYWLNVGYEAFKLIKQSNK